MSFRDKYSKRSHKIVEIKVFLIFCLLIRGSGSGENNDGCGSTTLLFYIDLVVNEHDIASESLLVNFLCTELKVLISNHTFVV